jgi:DNA-binding NtrC family response regulator
MKSERILLFDLSTASGLTNALRRILETQFSVADFAAKELPATNDSLCFAGDFEQIIDRFEPRVIFLVSPDAALETSGKFLASVKTISANIPVIAAIQTWTPDQALELLALGAADFVSAPFQATDVLARARKQIRQSTPDQRETLSSNPNPHSKKLIGTSPNFLQQVSKIPLIAGCAANVLIVGETGTGKELYARAIHYGGARAGRPFMPVNCGALPFELVENELFGHQCGAFTSASSSQIGLIAEAQGGTLFLDEIDCLPVFAQVKLLRFLQEKEYRPLGSARMRRANVRIIAASNLDPEEALGNGKMRQDLFYRLNIMSVSLPALRDRLQDIPLLANHFLAKYAQEARKQVTCLSDEVLHLLMIHNWPGNVRELEHAIQRAIVSCESEIIQTKDLLLSNSRLDHRQGSLQEAKAREIARFEKNYIQGVLSICKGNITRAAQIARKNRRAFWELIRKHKIDVNRFKDAVS